MFTVCVYSITDQQQNNLQLVWFSLILTPATCAAAAVAAAVEVPEKERATLLALYPFLSTIFDAMH